MLLRLRYLCMMVKLLNNRCMRFHLETERHCLHWSVECNTPAITLLLNNMSSMNIHSSAQDRIVVAQCFCGHGSVLSHQLCKAKAHYIGIHAIYCSQPTSAVPDQLPLKLQQMRARTSCAWYHWGNLINNCLDISDGQQSVLLTCDWLVYDAGSSIVRSQINHVSTG